MAVKTSLLYKCTQSHWSVDKATKLWPDVTCIIIVLLSHVDRTGLIPPSFGHASVTSDKLTVYIFTNTTQPVMAADPLLSELITDNVANFSKYGIWFNYLQVLVICKPGIYLKQVLIPIHTLSLTFTLYFHQHKTNTRMNETVFW